jgi:signal transduction histidine kinase
VSRQSSLARRTAIASASTLWLALGAAGFATAGAMHWLQVRALDQALLAAAHERAHPDISDRFEIDHSEPLVDAWLPDRDDPRVPPYARAQAFDTERPVFVNVGDQRVALLAAELEHRLHERDEHHRLVAAAAPRVTLARSVLPFAVPYSLFGALAGIAAGAAQIRVVRRALAPLDDARRDTEAVIALGQGQRLRADAPVEIHGLLASVNALLDRLDDASSAQTHFTAEAAHELRTPITVMLGELDVALRQPRDATADQAALRSLREEVDRLRRLTEGLLTLARLDAGEADRHREPIRAAELASRVLAAERPTRTTALHPIQLVVLADPELDVHAALVEAALSTLLRNAARHAPGAPVRVTVDVDGDHAQFTVDDGGPGVPASDRDALFDRFARSGQARRRDRGGLGLGLPLAREIARRHGGDCTLHDSPLGGARATLTVRLPQRER